MPGADEVDDETARQRRAAVVALFEQLPEMIVVIDGEGRISLVNQRALDVLGYEPDDVLGRSIFDYVHPDDLAYMAWSWEKRQNHPGELGILVHARGRNADGSWRPVEILGLSLLDDPAVGGMVMSMRELRGDDAITESPARLRSLIDRTSDVLLLLDADGAIRFANRRLTSGYGHDHDRIEGSPLASILHPDDQEAVRSWLDGLVAAGDRATATVRARVVDPGGHAHHVGWRGTNQLDDPLIAGIIVTGRDIDELVAMEARVRAQTDELAHAASHDHLTGLLNRAAFYERAEADLARRRHVDEPGDAVVLFCDLDRFKAVNDSLGHEVGDRVLAVVADRLVASVREGDVVGRYGGDEFTVLLAGDVAPATVTALVARITARLSEPVAVDDVVTEVGVSVGVGRAPVADADVDGLLHEADRSMYDRKAASGP